MHRKSGRLFRLFGVLVALDVHECGLEQLEVLLEYLNFVRFGVIISACVVGIEVRLLLGNMMDCSLIVTADLDL